ncbi:MAG: hypothetical protein IH851_04635 [Armatimonadetes bacterium]|nr:hypothetical protein [Armatimonadota bacterium]
MIQNAWKRSAAVGAVASCAMAGWTQIPDLLSFFEPGGRAMGMGGAIYSNAADVSASYWNPAGLAYISDPMAEINFRNRPTTSTVLTGTFIDPDRDGETGFGSNAFTFGGIAFPVGNGVIGLSYAQGGYARELAIGSNLGSGDPGDPTFVERQVEFLRVVTEFVTLAWGTSRGNNMNIGVGVVFARQTISDAFFRRTIPGGTGDPIISESDFTGAATGFGGIVGAQFASENSNVSFGVSYRSEITLNSVGEFALYSQKIPARIQGGVVWRADGLRGGQDFVIGGVDVAFFPSASSGLILARDEQVSAGIGFEYNWAQSFGYLPIRIGFRTTGAATDGFDQRNVFTFGVGYRPHKEGYVLELNFASGDGQSRPDVALSASFPIGK